MIIQILFCYKTLHVSGIFSAHHQEFSTLHSALVSFMQVQWLLPSRVRMLGSCHQTCMKLTSAECKVENSWRWAEKVPKTWLVIYYDALSHEYKEIFFSGWDRLCGPSIPLLFKRHLELFPLDERGPGVEIFARPDQGRIKLFGAPRQWKHFRPLFQAVFLWGWWYYPPRLSQTPPLPVPRQK